MMYFMKLSKIACLCFLLSLLTISPLVAAEVNCGWYTTTTNVCVTDASGTSCTNRTYEDFVCFDAGGGGSGGTGGGGGGPGGGGGGTAGTTNPFDADGDDSIDCFTDLTDSALVTSQPLEPSRNLGGRYGGPNDGVRWSHNGVDIRASRGDPVRAAQAGEVFEILTGQANTNDNPNSNVNGNFVRVRHADNSEGTYLHLHTVGVAVGDPLEAGQVVGTANNTGNSDGDHLHYTHWIDRYSSPKVAANPETLHGDCP